MATLPLDHATMRIVARPQDVNAAGDIFGGWLVAQADIAGSIVAVHCIKGRVVTVAIEQFHFIKPVLVGDVVSLYGEVERVGRSSIRVHVDIYIERQVSGQVIIEQVADGQFIYVHIDDNRQPKAI